MIYVGQTALRVQLVLGVDLSEMSATKIKYKKPSGDTGEWDAVVANVADGTIYYDVEEATEIDEPGNWTLWGHLTKTDGREAPGEPFVITVKQEGSLR